MKKYFLLFTVFAVSTIQAQEIHTLSSPITKPNQTTIRLEQLHIEVFPAKTIRIQWTGNNGEAGEATYPTPPPSNHPAQPSGATLLNTLNKMNFSGVNPSLVNRVLTRLQTDGYIPAGTISGTPE